MLFVHIGYMVRTGKQEAAIAILIHDKP
jgi:hypothetical protein